jgi:hypothetical protein
LVSPNATSTGFTLGPPDAGPYTGTLAFLLPYVEQNNVYNQLPAALFQYGTTSTAWAYSTPPFSGDGNNTGFPVVCNAQIKSYQCPSDNAQDTSVTTGIWDMLMWYSAANGWTGDYVLNTPGFGAELGATNYVPNGGSLLDAPPSADTASNGAFLISCVGPFVKNSKTKLTAITDGTSNTFAFGETLGGQAPPNPRDFKLAWMGSSSMWADWGLQPDASVAWYMYSSKHAGIVQFSMCDGSVRGIPKTATGGAAGYNAFQEMSGKGDGYVIDQSQF